jgi:hypothetical protein
MKFTTRELVGFIRNHGAKSLEEIKEYDKSKGLSLKPIDYERAINEALELKVLTREGDKYVYQQQD